jgi:predicted small secreted protein
MQRILLTVALLTFVMTGLTGCHTLQGAKQDVQEVPAKMTAAGHAVLKTDDWIKENMW